MGTMEQLPLRQGSLQQYQEKLERRRRLERAAKIAAVCGIAVLLVVVIATSFPRSLAGPPYVAELKSVVRTFQDQNFSAAVCVSVNGESKFADAIGLASEELNVPLQDDSVFPIASNSKLFVSVALYQLQERGLVNLSLAVNDYLDESDFIKFGIANQTRWCPRLLNASSNSPCEIITFVNLLNMGSGIGDSLNCDNVETQYCRQAANDLAVYKGSIGAYVGAFINDPLVFKPGSNYSYSNPNYYLLSYLVEKFSGQALEVYVKEQILDKIGLADTFYDPYSGLLGVSRGYIQQYVDYYVQGKGDQNNKPAEYLATGTCSPYSNSGALSGSGGFRSTTADMHKWYNDLFHNHGRSSKVLSAESISNIVHRRNPTSPNYAQGVGVIYTNESVESDWPQMVTYCGGMKCALTCMGMKILSPERSVVASVFTNHIQLYFATRADFEAWRPKEFIFTVTEGFASQGNGVAQLLNALMSGFLKFF